MECTLKKYIFRLTNKIYQRYLLCPIDFFRKFIGLNFLSSRANAEGNNLKEKNKNFIDLKHSNMYILPDPYRERKNEEEFIDDIINVGNRIRILTVISANVIPQKDISFKCHGIILGHIVRLYKCFDSFLYLITDNRVEPSWCFIRLISDTFIKFKFLLKNKDTDFIDMYIKSSLARQKNLYQEIEKRKKTPPLPIEHRIQSSIVKTIEQEGYTLAEIDVKRDKKLLPQYKEMAKDCAIESVYGSGFELASDFIHGSWHELRFYHLIEKDGCFEPNLEYTTPTPQLLESTSILVVQANIDYLKYISGNEAKELIEELTSIISWFHNMTSAHEIYLKTIQPLHNPE